MRDGLGKLLRPEAVSHPLIPAHQFREIVTGPFVVCTRIGFPPPPSGMFSSREMRPETVTGMSVRIGPFTVPTSSEAA